jgi:hypothetical protein
MKRILASKFRLSAVASVSMASLVTIRESRDAPSLVVASPHFTADFLATYFQRDDEKHLACFFSSLFFLKTASFGVNELLRTHTSSGKSGEKIPFKAGSRPNPFHLVSSLLIPIAALLASALYTPEYTCPTWRTSARSNTSRGRRGTTSSRWPPRHPMSLV